MKKVISTGLAASLLFSSLGTTHCFADNQPNKCIQMIENEETMDVPVLYAQRISNNKNNVSKIKNENKNEQPKENEETMDVPVLYAQRISNNKKNVSKIKNEDKKEQPKVNNEQPEKLTEKTAETPKKRTKKEIAKTTAKVVAAAAIVGAAAYLTYKNRDVIANKSKEAYESLKSKVSKPKENEIKIYEPKNGSETNHYFGDKWNKIKGIFNKKEIEASKAVEEIRKGQVINELGDALTDKKEQVINELDDSFNKGVCNSTEILIGQERESIKGQANDILDNAKKIPEKVVKSMSDLKNGASQRISDTWGRLKDSFNTEKHPNKENEIKIYEPKNGSETNHCFGDKWNKIKGIFNKKEIEASKAVEEIRKGQVINELGDVLADKKEQVINELDDSFNKGVCNSTEILIGQERESIKGQASDILNNAKKIPEKVVKSMSSTANAAFGKLRSAANTTKDFTKEKASAAKEKLGNTVETTKGYISNKWNSAKNLFVKSESGEKSSAVCARQEDLKATLFGDKEEAVKRSVTKEILNNIADKTKGIWNNTKEFSGKVSSSISDKVDLTKEKLVNAANATKDFTKEKASAAKEKLGNTVETTKGYISNKWNSAKNLFVKSESGEKSSAVCARQEDLKATLFGDKEEAVKRSVTKEILNNIADKTKGIWNNTKEFSGKVSSSISDKVDLTKEKLVNAANSAKNFTKEALIKAKNTTVNAAKATKGFVKEKTISAKKTLGNPATEEQKIEKRGLFQRIKETFSKLGNKATTTQKIEKRGLFQKIKETFSKLGNKATTTQKIEKRGLFQKIKETFSKLGNKATTTQKIEKIGTFKKIKRTFVKLGKTYLYGSSAVGTITIANTVADKITKVKKSVSELCKTTKQIVTAPFRAAKAVICAPVKLVNNTMDGAAKVCAKVQKAYNVVRHPVDSFKNSWNNALKKAGFKFKEKKANDNKNVENVKLQKVSC